MEKYKEVEISLNIDTQPRKTYTGNLIERIALYYDIDDQKWKIYHFVKGQNIIFSDESEDYRKLLKQFIILVEDLLNVIKEAN